MHVRAMTIEDYDLVMALLSGTNGVRLRSADSVEAIARFLDRNPGLSFVAVEEERVVGCVMAGHDGRRGYLHHLAVRPQNRRAGVGSTLVDASLKALERLGVTKVHIDVLSDNKEAIVFWEARGWKLRKDILRLSIVCSHDANA